MIAPELRIVLRDGTKIEERYCGWGPFITSMPTDNRNILTEIHLSTGKIDEVGLYADVFYHFPVDASEEDRSASGIDARYKERMEFFTRIYYVDPAEAEHVISVTDGHGFPMFMRLNGRLVDCRMLRLLQSERLDASEDVGTVDAMVRIYHMLYSEIRERNPREFDQTVRRQVASQMNLPLDVIEFYLDLAVARKESAQAVSTTAPDASELPELEG